MSNSTYRSGYIIYILQVNFPEDAEVFWKHILGLLNFFVHLNQNNKNNLHLLVAPNAYPFKMPPPNLKMLKYLFQILARILEGSLFQVFISNSETKVTPGYSILEARFIFPNLTYVFACTKVIFNLSSFIFFCLYKICTKLLVCEL